VAEKHEKNLSQQIGIKIIENEEQNPALTGRIFAVWCG